MFNLTVLYQLQQTTAVNEGKKTCPKTAKENYGRESTHAYKDTSSK